MSEWDSIYQFGREEVRIREVGNGHLEYGFYPELWEDDMYKYQREWGEKIFRATFDFRRSLGGEPTRVECLECGAYNWHDGGELTCWRCGEDTSWPPVVEE